MGLVVKVEPLHKTFNLIPQCKRCQAFGHTQKYCMRDFIYVKCAGKHPTNRCPSSKDQKAKCANCRGEHLASYRGCIVAKEQKKKRKTTLSQKI